MVTARAFLSEAGPTEPDRTTDPVRAVLEAHHDRRLLALATSGTTGAGSRRVLRTTDSWWTSFEAYSELTGVTRGARVFVPGPLTATMNLFAAVHAGAVGATVVDAAAEATHACLTPAQLDQLGGDLRRGTRVEVAGDRLPDSLVERARTRGLALAHYYGAAELSFVAAAPDAGPLTAFPGVQLEVRAGEIWVRSPYLCQGSAGDPGTFRQDDDGWATVGDLGQYDGTTLVVHGRPDHVVTGGATVSLADVESVLSRRARGPMAVCGTPHPTLGSVITAVLTDPADQAPLAALARAQLPPAQRPRLWRVVPALPLTPAGKVDRLRLASDVQP